MMKKKLLFLIAFLFVFSTGKVMSQVKDTINPGHHAPVTHPAPGSSDAQASLAAAAANPIASMISVPMQFNFNFGTGDYKREQTTLNFEPVLPFKLFKWNVVTRMILPIVQKPQDAASGSDIGVGDMNMSMFFVPPVVGLGKNFHFTWGFGPSFNIPTASTTEFGSGAFGVGPTLVALVLSKHLVAGFTFNQVWSYNPAYDYSAFFAQYFITWNIKNGWYINTTPAITANWKADEGQVWTMPVGLGFGKIVKTKVPMKFQLQAYSNAVRPDGGAPTTLQFQWVVMFPRKPAK
jgi:hypothetical protein